MWEWEEELRLMKANLSLAQSPKQTHWFDPIYYIINHTSLTDNSHSFFLTLIWLSTQISKIIWFFKHLLIFSFLIVWALCRNWNLIVRTMHILELTFKNPKSQVIENYLQEGIFCNIFTFRLLFCISLWETVDEYH
jgi:hypothetical protein